MPEKWEKLQEAVAGADEIQIILHDDPDPDAIASGAALRYLLAEKLNIEAKIAHRGVIGRAENRALVDYLGVELITLANGEYTPAGGGALDEKGPLVAVVDTQPGAGNSPVPAHAPVAIVIDHHGDLEASNITFRDVRPWVGASSTIVAQYFEGAEVQPPMKLASGLFYGIKTDTKALSRDTSAADVAAYFYLLAFVDVDAVVEIENAQVPPAYFRNLARALEAASIYDGAVFANIGELDYPDLVAEIADLFARLKGVDWVVCVGAHEGTLHFSVRTLDESADAEKMALSIIGQEGSAGGRNTLAGGQMPLDGRDMEEMADTMRRRALEYLGVSPNAPRHSLI